MAGWRIERILTSIPDVLSLPKSKILSAVNSDCEIPIKKDNTTASSYPLHYAPGTASG